MRKAVINAPNSCRRSPSSSPATRRVAVGELVLDKSALVHGGSEALQQLISYRETFSYPSSKQEYNKKVVEAAKAAAEAAEKRR